MIGQAVILVGGRGTRLGPLTRETPKPLLPVAGRPFLALLIDELRRHDIAEILLLAGFQADRLYDAFGQAPDVRILAEPAPLGTGGALRLAAPHLAERFFFLNGDSLFDVNLWDLARMSVDAEGGLALRQLAEGSRYGAVALAADGQISGFSERPGEPAGAGLINGGVGCFHREIVDRIPAGRPVSMEADIYPLMAAAGVMRGRVYDRPFIDIGVPDDYARAQSFIPKTLRRAVFMFSDALIGEAGDAIKAVNDAGHLAVAALEHDASEAERQAYRRQVNQVMTPFGGHLDAATSIGPRGAWIGLDSSPSVETVLFLADPASVGPPSSSSIKPIAAKPGRLTAQVLSRLETLT